MKRTIASTVFQTVGSCQMWESVCNPVCVCYLIYTTTCTFKTGRSDFSVRGKKNLVFDTVKSIQKRGKKKPSFFSRLQITFSEVISLNCFRKIHTICSNMSWGLVLRIQTGDGGCVCYWGYVAKGDLNLGWLSPCVIFLESVLASAGQSTILNW